MITRSIPLLLIASLASSQTFAMGVPRIEICHVPPDDPETARTIIISEKAYEAHINHGDFDGPCSDNGGCPTEMARVDDFCIDRWEARLIDQSPYAVPTDGIAVSEGLVVPQGYISQEVADVACQNAGKRLCTSQEWLVACQGVDGWNYPYESDERDADACNDFREVHPVMEVFGPTPTWSSSEINDPSLNQLEDSLDLTGENENCVSPEGVYDLVGNLNEWVADVDGTFRGGSYVEAWVNGEGCNYLTTVHNIFYHDFSSGFRCCMSLP